MALLARDDPDFFCGGEENDVINEENTSHIWHIDPIDGTTNFIRGMSAWCVSIGYEKNGFMQNGAIYVPLLNELYYAEKDKGAFCNKKKIKTSTYPFRKNSLFTPSSRFKFKKLQKRKRLRFLFS